MYSIRHERNETGWEDEIGTVALVQDYMYSTFLV